MNTTPNVALIDYGAGNQASVARAFKYIGANVFVLSRPQSMQKYSHIVLPGVGSFKSSIKKIRELNWDECLIDIAKSGKPLLGICLGMQLLFTEGYEDGFSFGLDIIPGEVNSFSFDPKIFKLSIPHVGFDTVKVKNDSMLFKNFSETLDFYFTHSYRAICSDKYTASETIYGENFVSTVEKDNVVGTQFHPEKSQKNGLNLLKNFLNNYK